jgi:hypothetical protein
MDIRNYPKSIFCNQKIQILTVMIWVSSIPEMKMLFIYFFI